MYDGEKSIRKKELLAGCSLSFLTSCNSNRLNSLLDGTIQGIFDRYDRDRSGKIDSDELREALRGLGYAVPPSVIELLIANYNNGVSRRGALDFDNFVECGMVVKGLTEKFKEKDSRYTGSAALTYDSFLSMVIPFIVP